MQLRLPFSSLAIEHTVQGIVLAGLAFCRADSSIIGVQIRNRYLHQA